MKTLAICFLLATAGCVAFQNPPPACYVPANGYRRCFAGERALSADVAREQLATELAVEERAKVRALAVVAERDAHEAAERARSTVERSDRIQDDAFDVLVEIREAARERETQAATQQTAP